MEDSFHDNKDNADDNESDDDNDNNDDNDNDRHRTPEQTVDKEESENE